MIKTFIFDLGKVIVNFDHSRIIQRIEQFSSFKSDEINQLIFSSVAVRNYEIGKISSLEFFNQVKKTLNLQMDFAEFSNAWTCTFDLKSILSEKLIEGLSKKYRLLILSDTNELHFEFIKANFPILRYFNDYVLSYKVGTIKPDPKIFQAVIQKANCLPEECFFTDDRKANIEGAQNIGINALQFFTAEKFAEDLQRLKL